MLTVDMKSLWDDDIDKVASGINEATSHINSYIDCRTKKRLKKIFKNVIDDINKICSYWTENTYVGNRKNQVIEKSFQGFFESLMKLLLLCREKGVRYEKSFAEKVLYRGTIYRYLGNESPSEEVVEPKYNNIYVSWSKVPCNSYIESKLYGVMTWLSCNILEPLYGIDIEAIGCSKASEREVVFPTIKNCITEIKYIREENE